MEHYDVPLSLSCDEERINYYIEIVSNYGWEVDSVFCRVNARDIVVCFVKSDQTKE